MTGEQEHKYLAFTLADQEFASDIAAVREIRAPERVAPLPESPDYLLGVMDLRGQVVPVVDLRRRFRMPPRPAEAAPVVVIVEVAGQVVGMMVDRVTEVLSLPSSAWTPPPPLVQGPARAFVAGVADLEGRLIVLLDLSRVLSAAEAAEIAELAASA